MLGQISRFRSVLALIFGLSMLSASAFAQGYGHQGGYHGNRYHYRGGHWYNQGEVIVPNIIVGEEIVALPPQYTTVVVGNVPYYYYNNMYYNQAPDGAYVVVAAPVRPARPFLGIRVNL